MRAWLFRGCALALLHAAAQVLLAELAVASQGTLAWARPVTLVLLLAIAFAAGVRDAHRREPGMLWLKASLVAGWLAGLLGVIGKSIFVDETGASALGDALTGGAAFTALLVLAPVSLGLIAERAIRRFRYGPAADDDDSDADGSGPNDETQEIEKITPQLDSPPGKPSPGRKRGGITSKSGLRG
jgi:hypothetical protein